jgi:hypothetical protein
MREIGFTCVCVTGQYVCVDYLYVYRENTSGLNTEYIKQLRQTVFRRREEYKMFKK